MVLGAATLALLPVALEYLGSEWVVTPIPRRQSASAKPEALAAR
jgi:hypothetical protein